MRYPSQLILLATLCASPYMLKAEEPTPPASSTKPASSDSKGGDKKTAVDTAKDKASDAKPSAQAPDKPKPKTDSVESDYNVVVSAARLPTAREKTGVSISVITARDLELSQTHQLSDDLRLVPGMQPSQSGKRGDLTTLFTRGGNSNHTLMMYDGFKVNQQGTRYNFESMDPIGADRVEIARGPASVLYGTEAVTGSINVLTKKGEGRPQLTTSFAAGTYGQDREELKAEGRVGKFSYHTVESRWHRTRASVDNSDVEQVNYAGRFDYDFSKDQTLELLYRGVQFEKGWYEDTPNGMGVRLGTPDPNDKIHNDDILGGMVYTGRWVPIWQTQVRAGYYQLETRNYKEAPGTPTNFFQTKSDSFTRLWRPSVDWQNNITAYQDQHITNTVTAGYSFEYERFNQASKTDPNPIRNRSKFGGHTMSGYLQNRLELYDRAFLTLGWRHEKNDDFPVFDPLRADLSILIPESESRVFGSIGNAYRAPTFFELFDKSFGNTALIPEKNNAFDFGLEQHFWKKRLTFSGTYFKNSFQNLIGFDPVTFRSIQAGKARSKGVEFSFTFKPLEQLTIEGASTWLQTEDNAGRRQLRRSPKTHTGRVIVHPLIGLVNKKYDGLDLNLEVFNTATRIDTAFFTGIPPRPRNPGYTRVDAAISYRFLEHFRVFGRGENLTDTKYENVFSFPAEGANFMGGVEFNWKF